MERDRAAETEIRAQAAELRQASWVLRRSWMLRRKGVQSVLAAVGWGQHRGSNSKGWTALHLAAADGHVACRWSCSSQGDWQGR
jgi:hypothetical protein